jgi:hypothetical protein
MGDDYGNQAAASQQIGQAPHHAKKRSGYHYAKPGKKALIQVACVGEPEGEAGDKSLHRLAITHLSELGHEIGAKEYFFTETSGDSKSEGSKEMESMWQERR